MKTKKIFGLLALISLLIGLPLVVAAEVDDFKYEGDASELDGMTEVQSMIAKVIAIVQYVAVGVAVLFASITGIQFMGANDPMQKKHLGDRLKYILIGLAIVVLSFPIVNLIL